MIDDVSGRHDIACRIRELRDAVGVSVAEAAIKMEIPLEAYLAYESGEKDIPISVLYSIAGRFGVDLTDLMTGQSPNLRQFCVVRAGKGPEIERFPGYRFESLAFDFQNRSFEPLLVTIDPEKNHTISLVTHEGQEFNLVLKGRVKVVLGGKEVVLSSGDSIYFDSMIPHGQLAMDEIQAEFLTVIMHASRGVEAQKERPLC